MTKNKYITKKDYQAVLSNLLDPLLPFFTKENSGIDLGGAGAVYEQPIIEMEAFARPVWGLAPLWAGGGSAPAFEEKYRAGLIAGTDPEGSGSWGEIRDFDQRIVEMAALATAILISPDVIWNPLSQKQKEHAASWLLQVNEHKYPDNNWRFFGVLVNCAMKKAGMAYSEEKLQAGLDRVEDFYRGGGWYTDGDTRQKDYYISFAMHYYGLIYAAVMEADDPERCALYKARAMEFAQDFIYWFSEDGSSIPYGRSLTYRFAQTAFWSACLFAGVEPFPVEVMKGIIARHLESWLSDPIFDNAGILTIGYRYPNLIMSENYNAPGSPYWSCKAFLFLALPDDHPFWSVSAAPMPKLEPLKQLKNAERLISRRDGDVTAYSPGWHNVYSMGHMAEKYGKFAYSTKFGFSVSRSTYLLEEAAPDSMLAFEADGLIHVRRESTDYRVEADRVVSIWSPLPGVEVETELIPTGRGHIRRHTIRSERACTAHDCGFAVSVNDMAGFRAMAEGGRAEAANPAAACIVESKDGFGEIIDAYPNTNLLYPKTKIPAVRYDLDAGESIVSCEIITR